MDPTSTRIVDAPLIHSAGAKIHFSFKIAPEQKVGTSSGLPPRYVMINEACHGNEPASARLPFAIRGFKLKRGVNAFFATCKLKDFPNKKIF